MCRRLIIGSEGQLGTELSRFLSNKYDSDSIILTDIREESKSELIYHKLDAINYKELELIVKRYDIEEIYHLAAILSAKGEENPKMTWDLNMSSLFNVLELAKNKIVKKVFWPSSISVFGHTSPKNNTNQFCVMEPDTIYGISKLSGERWCEYYNIKYGTDIRSLRFPGIISYNTLPGGGTTDYAVEIFYSYIRKENYKCFLRRDTLLPMIFIDDAIESIDKIMTVNRTKLSIKSSYNLSGFSVSPDMISNILIEKDPSFSVSFKPDFRQDIADSWPNSINDDYAKKDWGWEAKFDLDKTVNSMVKNLKIKI